MHAGLFCVDVKEEHRTSDTEPLPQLPQKKLLQDSSVKMLVLQLPSSAVAGQKPYTYPWFSQVCESWLDSASRVLVLQGAGPQALVVSAVTREPCWDIGWCHNSSHSCAHEHQSCDLPQRLFDPFLSPWSP